MDLRAPDWSRPLESTTTGRGGRGTITIRQRPCHGCEAVRTLDQPAGERDASPEKAASGVRPAAQLIAVSWTIHHYLFVDSTGAGQGMTLVTNTYDGTSGYLEPPGPPPAPRCTGRSTYSISPLINTATTNGHWTRTTMDGMGRTVHVTRPGYSGALLPLDPAGR